MAQINDPQVFQAIWEELNDLLESVVAAEGARAVEQLGRARLERRLHRPDALQPLDRHRGDAVGLPRPRGNARGRADHPRPGGFRGESRLRPARQHLRAVSRRGSAAAPRGRDLPRIESPGLTYHDSILARLNFVEVFDKLIEHEGLSVDVTGDGVDDLTGDIRTGRATDYAERPIFDGRETDLDDGPRLLRLGSRTCRGGCHRRPAALSRGPRGRISARGSTWCASAPTDRTT